MPSLLQRAIAFDLCTLTRFPGADFFCELTLFLRIQVVEHNNEGEYHEAS
jgi:hypothetical protein